MKLDDTKRIEDQIYALIQEFYEVSEAVAPFVPGEDRIPLMRPSYSAPEVVGAVRSLLAGQLTMNQDVSANVGRFEEAWSEYVGVGNGVMVNSGSSANLLALFALTSEAVEPSRRIRPGDEVITPAVTWTTTVSPIYHVGARPVFVDVCLEDCTLDPAQLEAALSDRTKAVMPVHLLGNPSNMDEIRDFTVRHGLHLIEDCCEAHGAEWNGRRVGSFGDLGTFSFFFSHHLSTIEGGMVMTSDDRLAEQLRAMRSQGVLRNMRGQDQYLQNLYEANESYRDIDVRYMFVTLGFNVRPTEINGAFGIEQVKRIDSNIESRQETARAFHEVAADYARFLHLIEEREQARHVYFGYPLIVRDGAPFSRSDLVKYLEGCGIETRPIMSGLVTRHPALRAREYRQVGALDGARTIHEGGFFLTTDPSLTVPERDYIRKSLGTFLGGFG